MKADLPVNFGILLYPGFKALDVFGSLDTFNELAYNFPMNLIIIGPTLDPVSTKPSDPSLNRLGSNFGESIIPTHDFNNAPPLDVLLIPGGRGSYDHLAEGDPLLEFVKRTYPSLKYLLTVCTGSWIPACAGILDGKRATSDKLLWKETKVVWPNVKWVFHARWVVDGNIWTSSGVSAGMNAAFAFVREVYGSVVADKLADDIEYERHQDPHWDPFADIHHVPREGI